MLFYIPCLTLLAAVQALKWKGVDWSSLLVEEAAGITYKNSAGTTEGLEWILRNNGVNTVRQRVWVNPTNGNYDLDYNIKLGNRAKGAGLEIYLDLHFSDTWADRSNQATPFGWPADIGDLTWELYNYTLWVCDTFQSRSIPISIISIGNEITGGLLYPLGSSSSYYNMARLLHSASSGIKDSTLWPQPKIMIHLDDGWNEAIQDNWYTAVLRQGPLTIDDFDIMGVSYYPFYSASATLSNLENSLNNLADKWEKQIVVAETNWPESCPDPAHPFPSDASSIPFSASGQTAWMQDVTRVVSKVKGGSGIFYWEPAWIQNANLGSSCANCLMVDQWGNARSSLAVFSSM